jgi:O-antigen/teichoic acid export membrane protein
VLKSIKINTLFRQIGTLASGVAIAQLIVFASQIVLRRLYAVELFGAFDVYYSIINVATAFVTLRYENAIVLTKYKKAAINILHIVVFFTFIFSSLLFLIIFCFHDFIIQILNFPVKYSFWLYFAPVSIFLFSTFQSINFWLIRYKRFKASAANKIIRRSFEALVQISFGLAKKNLGLVIGDITGNLMNVLYGIFLLPKTFFKTKQISKKLISYVLIKYKEFPLYNLLPNFLNTLSLAMPVFIINYLYNSQNVAQFNLSRQILLIPTALLATAISQVIYQKASEQKHKNASVIKNIKETALVLFVIAIVEIIFFNFLGKFAFSFIFGLKWAQAGSLSTILVIAFGLQLVISPFGNLLWVFDKLKIQAIWQIFYFISITGLFLVKNLAFYNFIILLTGILFTAYLAYGFLIIKAVLKYEKNLLNEH